MLTRMFRPPSRLAAARRILAGTDRNPRYSWASLNVTRYQNPEYDAPHGQARVEMDPDRQVELFIAMNDLSVEEVAEIPLVLSGGDPAATINLTGYATTSWISNYHDIANWRMTEG